MESGKSATDLGAFEKLQSKIQGQNKKHSKKVHLVIQAKLKAQCLKITILGHKANMNKPDSDIPGPQLDPELLTLDSGDVQWSSDVNSEGKKNDGFSFRATRISDRKKRKWNSINIMYKSSTQHLQQPLPPLKHPNSLNINEDVAMQVTMRGGEGQGSGKRRGRPPKAKREDSGVGPAENELVRGGGGQGSGRRRGRPPKAKRVDSGAGLVGKESVPDTNISPPLDPGHSADAADRFNASAASNKAFNYIMLSNLPIGKMSPTMVSQRKRNKKIRKPNTNTTEASQEVFERLTSTQTLKRKAGSESDVNGDQHTGLAGHTDDGSLAKSKTIAVEKAIARAVKRPSFPESVRPRTTRSLDSVSQEKQGL